MAEVRTARRTNEPPRRDDPNRVARAAPVALTRTPAAIVGLQRSAGNAAVTRWLAESLVGQGPEQAPKDVSGPEGEEEVIEEEEAVEEPATRAAESPRPTVVLEPKTTVTALTRLSVLPERGMRRMDAGDLIHLQNSDGNRAITHLLTPHQPVVQRVPDPLDNQSKAQPSATWLRVNASYSSILNKLGILTLTAPSRTRSRWRADILSEWDMIGPPGKLPDKELALFEGSIARFENNRKDEAGDTRAAWQVLQGPYYTEAARLMKDVNLGAKATQVLNEQYQETARRVAVAGDFLAPEDLDGLQNMLNNGAHLTKATELLAKEDVEAQQNAERQITAKLKLDKLSVEELASAINSLQGHVANIHPESIEYWTMSNHLVRLRKDLARRQGKPYEEAGAAYPSDIAMFSSYLMRGGYIEALSKLLPPGWAKLTQAELTLWLTKNFSEDALKKMYLEKYAQRTAIKAQFRKGSIISALVTGLIWARDNVKAGEWGPAAAKVGATGVAAYALNTLVYARDKSPAALMAAKGAEYGRWFQGAARSNKVVDFISRRLMKAVLIWDLKDLLMSGGGGGPNIPFDIIETVDINDPSTWKEPDQTLLDLGFNLWYRQACTDATPEACGMDLYLSKVEGSMLGGLGRAIDMLPHGVDSLKNKLYRIEGEYERFSLGIVAWVTRMVEPEENVLVISTGIRSGEMVSSKFGHYYMEKVIPANLDAVILFGNTEPKMVPQYVLHSFEPHVPGKSR